MSSSIEIFPDSDILVAAAGKRLVGAIGAAVAARGQALIVLTGGGNGIALLRYLSAQAQQIEWSKVHLFWGDERYVPEDDDERNLKQARRALLNHVDIPSNQVHPMAASDGDFGGDLDAAALAYEQVLAASAAPGDPAPNFDVHLLGMGPEGHINSLFPHSPAVLESTRMVVAVDDSPKPPPRRITLTLPAIQRSREVWLLVSGPGKPTPWPRPSAAPIRFRYRRPGPSGVRTRSGCWTATPPPSFRVNRVRVIMTVMADRSGRPAPVRRRMKTLTQAALNADKTVEQVEDVLDGLGKTMAELNSSLSQLNSTVERLEDGLDHLEGTLHSLDDLAKRLIVLVEPVEAIVDRIDYIVSLGETVMSPLSVTEHAVRGVLDRLRNRTVHEPTN
ncbi:6-phosphogluconolactonase [Mycobacterium tuberculosis]|nr:6-phosphogluconolactonase [Mycobacterium tuberculosis]